ncbi:MAG: AEC family transporter [Anaerolineae bacterium]
MSVLFNVVLPVFFVAAIAAIAQTWLRLEIRTLSRAVFYVFGPALVFDSLITSSVDTGLTFARVAAALVITSAILWVLGAGLARVLRLAATTRAAFLNAILLPNTGNYGLSVNLFAYGEAGLALAVLYFTASAVASASIGVYLSAAGRAPVSLALKRVLRVPFLYAAAVGIVFALAGWGVPEPIGKAVHLLGEASVPVMLSVLGLNLAETFRGRAESEGKRREPVRWAALATATAGRLLAAPAVTWVVTGLLGLEGLARDVTIVQSAMPTAVLTTILANEFDADPPFAALAVLATTLASLATITLLLNLLG